MCTCYIIIQEIAEMRNQLSTLSASFNPMYYMASVITEAKYVNEYKFIIKYQLVETFIFVNCNISSKPSLYSIML